MTVNMDKIMAVTGSALVSLSIRKSSRFILKYFVHLLSTDQMTCLRYKVVMNVLESPLPLEHDNR